MNDAERDLDVAISFVNDDLGLATELRDGLGDSLNVFVYTAKQEELAGTDGLQSFRDVFRRRARLVVVLFRERWGKTPWTRVEEEAITDRFLKEGPDFLFVVMLDKAAPPPWLPDKLIRFSLSDFGTEQAIGAIKARALEKGSNIQRPSAEFLAQRSQEMAQFAETRSRLRRSEDGVLAAQKEGQRVVQLVSEQVKGIKNVVTDSSVQYGAHDQWFVLKTSDVAIHGFYQNRIINVLDEAQFVVREMRGDLLLPGQPGYYLREPIELAKVIFLPDITRDLGWCWKSPDDKMMSSNELADLCIERFFKLRDRHSAGELPSVRW